MRILVAIIKLIAFLALTFVLIPFQCIVLLLSKGDKSYYIPRLYHVFVCLILRLKVEVVGTPLTSSTPVFFIGNHLSSMDIPVLGSIIKASFVAKKEIKTWPLFGFLATIQQTAFISRSAHQTKKAEEEISQLIRDGKNLIFFGEGSSSPGLTVKPFKSSIFNIIPQLQDTGLKIQPFTIILVSADQRPPITPEIRDIYAWHGDMDFVPHLWNLMKKKGAHVKLVFHDPVQNNPGEDRKALANKIRDIVAQPLDKALELGNRAV